MSYYSSSEDSDWEMDIDDDESFAPQNYRRNSFSCLPYANVEARMN